MIGHIGIATNYLLLYPNRKAGILFVGIFFLISGYGLMKRFLNNPNYLNDFLLKRLLLILLPAYVIYLLNGVLDILTLRQELEINTIFQYIFMGSFWKNINWYVFEIIFCYIIFYFVFKYMKQHLALISLILLSIVFITFGFIAKIQNPWYGSTLCFPLGIWYAGRNMQRENVKYFWLKNLMLLLICFSCILLFFQLGNDSMIGNPIARNVAAVSFSLWVVMLLDKVSLHGKVFQILGDISYEIFLIHPMIIGTLVYYECSNQIILLGTIISTLVLSYLIHIPIKKINEYISLNFSYN